MAGKGPPKVPTPILKLRGSPLANRRKNEPQPGPGRPICPVWLRLEAKRLWRKLVPQLVAMGVLGKCDRNALARYCQTWAKWRAAEELVMDQGDTYEITHTTGKGDSTWTEIRERPEVKRAERLADQLLRLEKEFGLTPSARASLATDKPNESENRGKRYFGKTG